MASLGPSSSGPGLSKVLTISVSPNNYLVLGPAALNSSNIYECLSMNHVEEQKVHGSIRDLILFVNSDGTLSLEGETLSNICASASSYVMNNIRLLRRGRIAEELTESEAMKYLSGFPQGVIAPSHTTQHEINVTDIDIEQAVQTMKSVLKSDDAKIILGENATAMLDILGIDESDDQPTAQTVDYIKRDHSYCMTPTSPTSSDKSPESKWDSPVGPQKNETTESANATKASTNNAGQKTSGKNPKVVIGSVNDMATLSKTCAQQKERARSLHAQLPSIPPQLLGGSPVKSSPFSSPMGSLKATPGLTEAMLDEKFRQELLDNEDYAPYSTCSDTEQRRIVFSPDKSSCTDTFESDFSSSQNTATSSSPGWNPGRARISPKSRRPLSKRGKPIPPVPKRLTEILEKKTPKREEVTPDVKLPDGKTVSGKKLYPKRENRRPPGRLQDALQPALFSAPDVIRRFSTEVKQEEKDPEEVPPVEVTVKRETPSQPEPENCKPVVDAVTPKEEPPKTVVVTEVPKKVDEDVPVVKKENVVKTPLKENQGDLPVTQAVSVTEPKVSKRIRKRKVVFSESDDTPAKGKKPKKVVVTTKKPPPGKPAKVKQSKPRQSLELSSGEEKEENEDDDNSSNASWNSEDDPDRLWCICKKPHNNRFMICCDSCLDWFHGHCVGVTKAQGKQMEEDGHEWTCPSCKKIKSKASPKEPTPPKPAAKAAKRRSTSPASMTTPLKRIKPDPKKTDKQSRDFSPSPLNYCIVCNKSARANSIYCSDECILKHAQTSKTSVVKSVPTKAEKKILPRPGEKRKGTKPFVNEGTKSVGRLPDGSLVKPIKPLSKYPVVIKKLNSPKTVHHKSSPLSNASKSSPLVKASPKPIKNQQTKSVTSTTKKPAEDVEDPDKPDPIRVAVRKYLTDVLFARLQNCEDFESVSVEEVSKTVVDIESELFKLFGQAGAKYKSKYRSLTFNIKDETNLTLFRKIAEKAVTPYELVRLSPEELASQQLAQWREQESKHQLDIIKKNELEMMQANKLIVMKTHKGEEVIEADRSNIKTSVLEFDAHNDSEDVANSNISAKTTNSQPSKLPSKSSSSRHKSSHGRDERRRSSRRDREKDRSSRKKSRRHKSTEKSTTRDDKATKKPDVKETQSVLPAEDSKLPGKAKVNTSAEKVKTKDTSPIEPVVPVEPEVLSKPVGVVNTETPDVKEIVQKKEPPASELKTEDAEKAGFKRVVWSGTVSMLDVCRFGANIQVVSGNIVSTTEDIPGNIEIVGRIDPQVVWQYIAKIIRSGSKKIQVVLLSATSDDDVAHYKTLYNYLNTRNRIGVAGKLPSKIKDMYILPLPKGSSIPDVLTPMEGPGVDEDHPDVLMAVVVRMIETRRGDNLGVSAPSTHSLTPPGYLPRKKSTKIKVKVSKNFPPTRINKEDYEEGDDPYSPGGESESVSSPQVASSSSDIAAQVEELNRKIELEKKEIAHMSTVIKSTSGESDDAYSPSASYTPPHEPPTYTIPGLEPGSFVLSPTIAAAATNITLPNNLEEILANVKKNAKRNLRSDPIVKNYATDEKEVVEKKETRRRTTPSYTPSTIPVSSKDSPASSVSVSSSASSTPGTTSAKSRDPRSAKAKASSTLSRLSDAELIEKANAEMGSTSPSAESGKFTYPTNYPPPGYQMSHPPPNYRPPMGAMMSQRMMGPMMGPTYPTFPGGYGSPGYMTGPPPPQGFNRPPGYPPPPIPGVVSGYDPQEGYHTRASTRERRGRARWADDDASGPTTTRTIKRPGNKRQKAKDPK